MKKSSYWKSGYASLLGVMLALITLCFIGCKDDKDSAGVAFDPSKPVVITDFMPKEGGYGSNLILYGDNFGNDPAKLKVTVGGQSANIISVQNDKLYCVVPQKAYDGDIQISICNDSGEEVAYAEAEGTFEYTKKWLVTTLVGTRYTNANDAEEKSGPFNDCGWITYQMWFSFDPQSNFDHLYVTTHKTKLLRKVDLANERVDILPQFSSGLDRPAIINWTLDENQDMILTDDRSEGSNVNAHFVFKRSTDFKNSEPLVNAKARSLTAAIVHPKNGELYYTAYYDQNIFRYDFETQQVTTPNRHFATKETIRMVVHPEGKYAYLMRYYHQNGGGYIARMDYDDNAKAFTDPYIICGTTGAGGYVDGVGDRAKVNKPAQGVFVKNPNYEGEEDEYDFYFCDEGNNCVRMMTPYGRITTFAGRGNGIATGDYADGELRTEARFNAPCAIAYDEKRKCFYVGDSGNNVIRKIALEE